MGVEIIEHDNEPLGGGEVDVDQFAHRQRPVDGGALRRDAHLSPAEGRRIGQEQIGAAAADVLGILSPWRSGPIRAARCLELLAGFVETHQRGGRIGRLRVGVEYGLHGGHETGVPVGGNRKRTVRQVGPPFLQGAADGFQEHQSITRRVSNRRDQRAYPGGGVVHARAAICKVWVLESLEGTGRAGGARVRQAIPGSPPRRACGPRLLTPTIAATAASVQAGPERPVSVANRMRARWSDQAER